jgi:CelD/BcsL family acetyltransferase involved in cellulose biosynthesis
MDISSALSSDTLVPVYHQFDKRRGRLQFKGMNLTFARKVSKESEFLVKVREGSKRFKGQIGAKELYLYMFSSSDMKVSS